MGRSKNPRDPTPAAHRLGLLLLVLLALGLRVPGLSWGLPSPDYFFSKGVDAQSLAILGPEPTPPASHIYSFHPDEVFPVKAAAAIALTGDLNPHFFNYGSLYIYLLAPLLRPLLTTHWPPVVSEACPEPVERARPELVERARPELVERVEPLATALLPIASAHLLGRFLTLIFSLATIILVFLIGRRLYDRSSALLAAGLLAIAPLHVVHSHFATVDVPLTFFTTLVLLFSLSAFHSPPGCHSESAAVDEESRVDARADQAVRPPVRPVGRPGLDGNIGPTRQSAPTLEVRNRALATCGERSRTTDHWRLKYLLLAAASSGLAASVKYSGITSLLLPLTFLLFPNKGFPMVRRLAFALGILAFASLAFLAACPFSLLSPSEFLADVRFELSHLATGGTIAFANTLPAPLYHITNSLPHALGYPFLAASIVGLALAFRRPRPGEWLLLLWTFLSFATASLSQEKFIRYTLPTLPCLALLTARLASALRTPHSAPGCSRSCRSLALALVALSALSALLISLSHLRYFTTEDAREQAATWITERLHAGDKIGLAEFPWFFTPPATPHNGGEILSGHDFPAWNQTARNALLIANWNPALLPANPPPFILLSDIEIKHRLRTNDPLARRFLTFLHSNYRLAARFGSKPSIFGLSLVGKYPPSDWEYHDPIIWIYERRG